MALAGQRRVASRLAVETIIERYYREPATEVEESLAKAIKRANQKILQESEKGDFLTMETTIVCAVIRGEQLYVAHLGDSRAYLMRSGELTRLTRDHSRVQALIDDQKLSEEQARSQPERNLITRSFTLAICCSCAPMDYMASYATKK
jgi:protein phosphatase